MFGGGGPAQRPRYRSKTCWWAITKGVWLLRDPATLVNYIRSKRKESLGVHPPSAFLVMLGARDEVCLAEHILARVEVGCEIACTCCRHLKIFGGGIVGCNCDNVMDINPFPTKEFGFSRLSPLILTTLTTITALSRLHNSFDPSVARASPSRQRQVSFHLHLRSLICLLTISYTLHALL